MFICAAIGHTAAERKCTAHAGGMQLDWLCKKPFSSLISNKFYWSNFIMIKTIHKGLTLVELLIIVFVIGLLAAVVLPPSHDSYPIRARVSELILAASSAKTALSEGMQEHHSWSATWMSAITISATGMVAHVSISPTGQIIVQGTPVTSNAIITMTPSTTTDNKLVWSCTGTPSKYMPASCR